MRLPEDRKIELPSKIETLEIARPAENYHRLQREQLAVRERLAAAESRVEQARIADRDAAAAVELAGKGRDPGEPQTAKALADVKEAVRREEVLAAAVAKARAELLAAVDEHGERELESIRKSIPRRRAALAKAIDELAKARAELAEDLARSAWIKRLPEQTLFSPQTHATRLPSLLGQNGDALTVEPVLAALRQLAEPPAPHEAPEPHPLLQIPRAA